MTVASVLAPIAPIIEPADRVRAAGSCSGCGLGLRDRYGPESLCWPCWAEAHGGERTCPQPPGDERETRGPRPLSDAELLGLRRSGIGSSVIKVLAEFAAALGVPVATPEIVTSPGGALVKADYRVFLWRCPACGGGRGDPFYRPLSVDSCGRIACRECGRSPRDLAVAVREMRG